LTGKEIGYPTKQLPRKLRTETLGSVKSLPARVVYLSLYLSPKKLDALEPLLQRGIQTVQLLGPPILVAVELHKISQLPTQGHDFILVR
jgi:hypothetical protein